MPRREKMLLCAGAVFLVLLFLMSSTDLIIKERAVQIDSISVILSEDTDDYYQNFRKGMEKAATDLRSDVRLITLYDRKDQDQQVELTTREIRDCNVSNSLFRLDSCSATISSIRRLICLAMFWMDFPKCWIS